MWEFFFSPYILHISELRDNHVGAAYTCTDAFFSSPDEENAGGLGQRHLKAGKKHVF